MGARLFKAAGAEGVATAEGGGLVEHLQTHRTLKLPGEATARLELLVWLDRGALLAGVGSGWIVCVVTVTSLRGECGVSRAGGLLLKR